MMTWLKMLMQKYGKSKMDETNDLTAVVPHALSAQERFRNFYELLGYMVWLGASDISVYRQTDSGKFRWTNRSPILNYAPQHPKYANEPLRVLRFYNDPQSSWSISWTYKYIDGSYVLARDCGNCANAMSDFCGTCGACRLFKLKKDWGDNQDKTRRL